MTKTINFVSKTGPDFASHRMRAEIPCQIINEESTNQAVVSELANPRFDINVFSKHFKPEEMFDEAYECRDRGSKVVFDICDNHFSRDAKEIYLKMIELSDIITCNTVGMQKKIEEVSGKKAFICSDPLTFPKGLPRVTHTKNPKIVWYGHKTNIAPVFVQRYKFTVISNYQATMEEIRNFPHITFLPWSLGLVESLIKNFDIVVIPTVGFRHYTKEKSPNRAVDALFAGKFVITDNLDIYEELEPFIYIGDIKSGIEWYIKHPSQAFEKIEEGQKYVEKKYNYKEIYKQWKNSLSLA